MTQNLYREDKWRGGCLLWVEETPQSGFETGFDVLILLGSGWGGVWSWCAVVLWVNYPGRIRCMSVRLTDDWVLG